MTDNPPIEPARSALMAKVRAKNTKPEIIVRQLLHALGYRFRLHAKELPGKPDIVFRRRKKVVFVHGCFWHRHSDCRRTTTPKTREDFWRSKFQANKVRDEDAQRELRLLGWESLVVWECETQNKDRSTLVTKLKSFLD